MERHRPPRPAKHREAYGLAHFVVPTRMPPREMYRLMRKYYFRVVWRAITRPKLYRPLYAFQRHIPRLIAGTLRNARMIARAHEAIRAPIPPE